ncbi:hypothetical protein ER308_19780 [Egibacter rhizosphaerae]|uniref:Uncharacterized protein n=2 Tax=Egibacter rhizosphaerae TaxID=1670831 RepID=A0A411YK68_9ACTN|nr:hypothetical protein ER308_19780 [Egibacter rhizosphaerae]
MLSSPSSLEVAGEPSELASLSPAVRDVATGAEPSGATEGLEIPEEVIPDEPVVVFEASGGYDWSLGELASSTWTFGFFAERGDDDGERFRAVVEEAGFTEERSSETTEEGLTVDRVEYVDDGGPGSTHRLTVDVGSLDEDEDTVVVFYDSHHTSEDGAQLDGNEHGWVNAVEVPGDAGLDRVNSGYVVPRVSLLEPSIDLQRRASFVIPTDDVDAMKEIVESGELVEGVDLSVTSEHEDDDYRAYDLESDEGDTFNVSISIDGVEDGVSTVTVRASLVALDVEIGSAIEGQGPDLET